MALNAITGVALAVCYMIELKRENWAIKYLDIDNDQSDNSIEEKLKHYPKIEKEMDLVNYYYLLVTKITTILYGINLIFSGILVKNNYYSSTTLSCYVSFSLLVILKLYNSLNVGYYSVKRDKILSAYMSEFGVSFNVIDADFS